MKRIQGLLLSVRGFAVPPVLLLTVTSLDSCRSALIRSSHIHLFLLRTYTTDMSIAYLSLICIGYLPVLMGAVVAKGELVRL